MIKILIQTILIFLVAYAIIVALLYFLQENMVYFPFREIEQTPTDIGLEYEEVKLRTQDRINIAAWFIAAEKERGVLLFCHGNAGNLSHRLDSISIFNSLDLSVLIFDYRGYGQSEGSPSEQGTYLDAEAAWDYLVQIKNKAPECIVVFGRSLGCAIAAEIAQRKNPGGLILESSFTSVPELGQKLYPWLPVKLMSKFEYATSSKIVSITCPKLIIHSPEDEIIPYEHGKKLYEKAAQPKEFLEIRGGHNEGFFISGTLYTEGLRSFFDKHLNKIK